MMRHPGFEPGSIAWKATILTTRLITRSCRSTPQFPFEVLLTLQRIVLSVTCSKLLPLGGEVPLFVVL